MKKKKKNIIGIVINSIIVIVSIFASIFAEDLREQLKNLPIFKWLLTPPRTFVVGIIFLILIIYQIYCLVSNVEDDEGTKKTKYTRFQKKFIEKATKEYTDPRNPNNSFKFEVYFSLFLGENPHIENLRYYDAMTGTTEEIRHNGIFRGMDCSSIRKELQAHLNTEWDRYNNR